MRVPREQLRGMSYEKAKLYGMPHIGCKYRTRNEMSATVFHGTPHRCACCGKTGCSHSRHHEPPKANGWFRLETPNGTFTLRPALIVLCGSGTTGCHGDRHSGRLRIRWEWDSEDEERKWWDGTFLSEREPHGDWLYEHGRYIFEHDGKAWEYRG